MHKGYAFVQFSNPVEAENACEGEDGRLVLNQNIGKIQLFFMCNGAERSEAIRILDSGQEIM